MLDFNEIVVKILLLCNFWFYSPNELFSVSLSAWVALLTLIVLFLETIDRQRY